MRAAVGSAGMALLLLVACAGTAAAYTPQKDSRSGQLSPSVLLMGEFDWALSTGRDGKPWSRCLDMVWKARSVSKGNRLNFVPTHHWLPRDDGFGVSQYCYLHTEGGTDRGTCKSWTPEKLAEFKKSMTLCFAEVFRQGFIPYVRPHLDDGLNRGIWRNGLLFGPYDKNNGYSYADVMTVPLAEAMRDALAVTAAEGSLMTPHDRFRPVVYMGLQGEMSATIMRYTSQWATMVPQIKSIIGNKHADVKVGIGLNFNALDATETHPPAGSGFFGLFGSGQRAARYPVPGIDGGAVNDLITNKIDFVGISAYAPYTGPGFAMNEFENSAYNVGDALRSFGGGVNLAGLANNGKIELHYSEFGIGGGKNGNAEIAASAAWCAKQPWAGVAGTYESSRDPWKRGDLAAFRREFYQKSMQWLSSPGARTYPVSEIFVWGMASWDMFGIYPDSSANGGTYRDFSLMPEIAGHNIAVIASKTYAAKGNAAAEQAIADLNEGIFGTGGNAKSSGGSAGAPTYTPSAQPTPASAPAPAPAPQQTWSAPAPKSEPEPPQRPVPAPAPQPQQRPRGGLFPGFLGLFGR